MNNRAEVLANLGDYGSADFSVRREPLLSLRHGISPIDGAYTDFTDINSHVALVREDTNKVLSVVGKGYKPVNHVDAFKTAENVIKLSDLDVTGIERETACSHDGARAYSIYTLPAHTVSIGEGTGDQVALTISARNSFDGSWSFVVEVGGKRFICLNMQVFANNFGIHKSKHTKGLNLNQIADKLSESVRFYNDETDLWQEMVDTSIDNTDAMSIMAHLAQAKTVDSHIASGFDHEIILNKPDVKRNKTLGDLWYYWNCNRGELGSTAWSLYNSMTEWATHSIPSRRLSQKNIASVKMDRLDRVRKTLNDKMLPALRLVA